MTSSPLNLPCTTVERLAAKNNVFIGKVKTNAGEANALTEKSKATRDKMAGPKLLVKLQDMHETKQRLVYQDLARRLLDLSLRRQLDAALHGRR